MSARAPREKPPAERASLFRRMWELEGGPHAVAGGIAVGVFFGVAPLWGVKTLLTFSAATALRFNPVAAIFALTAQDILTPFAPLILRLQYDLGYFLMSRPHHLPPKLELGEFRPESFLHWTTFFDAGLPLLLGGLLAAVPASTAAYFVFYWLLDARRRLKLEQKNAEV